jgi:hypothetical protein
MKFRVQVWNAKDGTFPAKEMNGPCNHLEWKRSFKVYSFGMRALKAASAPRMQKYAEGIEEMVATYSDIPGGGWWLIALGDMRMRSERMECIRRKLQAAHCKNPGESVQLFSSGPPIAFDPAKPCDSVFLAAAFDKEFLCSEGEKKATLYCLKLKDRQELVDEGHHADVLDVSDYEAEMLRGKRRRTRHRARG